MKPRPEHFYADSWEELHSDLHRPEDKMVGTPIDEQRDRFHNALPDPTSTPDAHAKLALKEARRLLDIIDQIDSAELSPWWMPDGTLAPDAPMEVSTAPVAIPADASPARAKLLRYMLDARPHRPTARQIADHMGYASEGAARVRRHNLLSWLKKHPRK